VKTLESLIKHFNFFLSRQREAGKVLSTDSEGQVRSALDALQALLNKVAPAPTQMIGTEEGNVQESAATGIGGSEEIKTLIESFHTQLEEAEISHDETRRAIYNVLRASRYLPDGTYVYRFLRDVYADYFVFEQCIEGIDRLYKCSYTIDEQGVAQVGEATEVRLEIKYVDITVATTEAGKSGQADDDVMNLIESCMPLVEKAVKADGTAKIKVIAPGHGSSGFYPESVLKRDLSKAFPKGTHMYWNHITPTESLERPERNLDDLAAVFLSDAIYLENGPDGPGGYADVDVKEHYRDKVDALAEDIGTSIYGLGKGKDSVMNGEAVKIIEQLIPDPFNTVDFVTKPGAGGKVLNLFESARRSARPATLTTPVVAQESTQVSTQPTHEENNGGDAGSQQINSPQEEIVTEAEIKELRDQLAEANKQIGLLTESSARQSEAILLSQSRTFVSETLASIEMPEPTRKRLAEKLSAAPVCGENGTLDKAAFKTHIEEAAKAEIEYLGSIVSEGGSGQIRGMNSTGDGEPVTLDEAAIDAQMEQAFQGIGLSESASRLAATAR
jgi:hypothetical protein